MYLKQHSMNSFWLKMKILIGLLTVGISSVFSQVGVSAGFTALLPFGSGLHSGFQIGVELPLDEESSYYGRLNIYGKRFGDRVTSPNSVVEAIDMNTTFPNYLNVTSQNSLSFTTLELGRKAYFFGSYDYGFSLYGGSGITILLGKARSNYSEYDENLYQLPAGVDESGSIIGLNFGLNMGAKQTFQFGTLFFDTGLTYPLLLQGSNTTASLVYNEFGNPSLFINFNLGFRKDLY
jgi:hypothetical protein